jgi:tRNA-2-methylthio-N6-dimethylallyladenosine synthase
VEALRDVPKLANYLHLPVQAGSDRVLAAMKRGYTALEFKQKIRKSRAVRPDISVSSDFIVGFPGESRRRLREDHEADRGCRFRPVVLVHLFAPSGTPAADLEDTVGSDEKHARLSRLQATINANAARSAMPWSAACRRVLVEARRRRTRTN